MLTWVDRVINLQIRGVGLIMSRMRLLVCVSFVLATGTALDAQWIKLTTPGLPRTADGKPNLTAPAPRTADGKPDLSGLWKNDGGDRLYNNVTADMQASDIAPSARSLHSDRWSSARTAWRRSVCRSVPRT